MEHLCLKSLGKLVGINRLQIKRSNLCWNADSNTRRISLVHNADNACKLLEDSRQAIRISLKLHLDSKGIVRFSRVRVDLVLVELPIDNKCINVIWILCKLVKGRDRLRHCLRNKIYIKLRIVLMIYRFSVY